MATFFDLAEPENETCYPRKLYNIAGIINGTIIQQSTQTGKFFLRVPLLTAKSNQLVVEIWNDNKKMEPKFADWKCNQFTLMRNVSYHGLGDFKCEKNVHVFRLRSVGSELNRFIWISPEHEEFWATPVELADETYDNDVESVSFKIIKNPLNN